MHEQLLPSACLPHDADIATLVGRVWVQGTGPVLVTVRPDGIHDISGLAQTLSGLLEL